MMHPPPGQATHTLAPYFSQVVGTDVSLAQVETAVNENTSPNVKFEVSSAEVIPSPDAFVQLVSVSQAAHWFDLPKFYKEGRRVLCKNGVLAFYGYDVPKFIWKNDPSKDQLLYYIVQDFYAEDLKGYWQDKIRLVDERYKSIVIPYEDFTRDETFYHEEDRTVLDSMNYFLTWSCYQRYCEANGQEKGKELIKKCQNRILEALGVDLDPESTIITSRTSFFLLLARNASETFIAN